MTENEVIREDRAEKLRQEQQTKEREIMKRNHLEALISEWKFQCAEGIETFPKDRMFEICYTDAYEQGRKEAAQEAREIIRELKLVAKENHVGLNLMHKAEAFLKENEK